MNVQNIDENALLRIQIIVHGFWPEIDFCKTVYIASERASQEEQNGTIP